MRGCLYLEAVQGKPSSEQTQHRKRRKRYSRLQEILTSLGFHYAKEYVDFPIVPGADGADTLWTRDEDLLQVSWSGGEMGPPPEYILRYAKQYKPRHPRPRRKILAEEILTLLQKRAGVNEDEHEGSGLGWRKILSATFLKFGIVRLAALLSTMVSHIRAISLA